jgi:hypothetical protein
VFSREEAAVGREGRCVEERVDEREGREDVGGGGERIDEVALMEDN